MNWGDYLSFEYGKPVADKDSVDGLVPVFGTNGQIGTSHLPPLCKIPSFIVGRKGAYRGVHYSAVPFSVIDTGFYALPKTDDLDLKWAYYKFLTYDINRMDSGSAIPSTDRYELYRIPIELPSKEVQHKVVSVLDSFETKIKNNTLINQNLSEQIQTIYDELIGKIDADPIEISSVIDVRDGTHDSPKAQETGLPLVTSKHLLPYGVDLSSPNKITKDDYDKINERSRVDTFDILLSMIGTVGIISLVVDSPVEFAIKNVGLFKTSATPELYPFVLAYLRSKSTMQHIEKVLAGSTQKYVSLGELRKLPIALPNSQQLIDFNAVVKPIIEQIIILTRENKQLTVLRDSLLPKLMSGELDVSEIEI